MRLYSFTALMKPAQDHRLFHLIFYHFAGGQAGHFHRGRHAVLHASALLGVRQDDRQRGHPPGGVPAGLPGQVLAGNFRRGRCEAGTV